MHSLTQDEPLLLTMKTHPSPSPTLPPAQIAEALTQARRIAAAAGLSPGALASVHLMAELSRHPGGMTMSQAARAMGHSTSAMTIQGDALENKGLAERRYSSEDRRKVTLHLTQAGQLALFA